MRLKILSTSPEDTLAAGKALGRTLKPGAVVGLAGELGCGKTVFAKGIADGLDVPQSAAVTSPTFTVINEYAGSLPLYHFDLYRLNKPSELEDIGASHYLWGKGVCVIEWADLFPGELPEQTIMVHFRVTGPSERRIFIQTAPDSAIDEPALQKAASHLWEKLENL